MNKRREYLEIGVNLPGSVHLRMVDVRKAGAAASHAQESLAEKVHFGRSTLPSAGVGGSIFGCRVAGTGVRSGCGY